MAFYYSCLYYHVYSAIVMTDNTWLDMNDNKPIKDEHPKSNAILKACSPNVLMFVQTLLHFHLEWKADIMKSRLFSSNNNKNQCSIQVVEKSHEWILGFEIGATATSAGKLRQLIFPKNALVAVV